MKSKKVSVDESPEAMSWGPCFCALAMGAVGTNVAIVTVVPSIMSRPFTLLTLWNPFDATCQAMWCLAVGFVTGAVVGLVAGLMRSTLS